MGSKALLVIDMLNDFVLQGSPLEVPDAQGIIPHIQRQIKTARKNNMSVIYICDSHDHNDREFIRMGWPPHALAGSKGARVIDQLKPSTHDRIILKKSYSGFFATDLDVVLKESKVSELVITGCVTNICVLYTAADAVQRGYKVSVVKDCVAALDQKDHEFALKQMRDVLGAHIL
ncbi:MAG: isochorismatase family cysteine hydrolase [Thermodesulfobacteriota bacterium]|nr:isochorismatase family cysteine hydrolase [Thermodesulfobacteriota bacterium]